MTPAEGGLEIDVRRSAHRAVTLGEGVASRHSFSFGSHYDPDNVGFGALTAHNDEVLDLGAGFNLHTHRDVEIVTWVLSGSMAHEDTAGHRGIVSPGVVQRLSAGDGIEHTERNVVLEPGSSSVSGSLRYVQMWLSPDEPGGEPAYDQLDVGAELATGELVAVAAGPGCYEWSPALRLKRRGAALSIARLRPGRSVVLPVADYLHVFVAAGAVRLEDSSPDGRAVQLADGDAARLCDTAGARITASGPGEILVWEMQGREPT